MENSRPRRRISLLESEGVAELGLQREAELCSVEGIEFVSYPVADRGVLASRKEAAGIRRKAALLIGRGRSVAFHCRAGIGRPSVMAACTLICAGVEAVQALADIQKARGVNIPDTEEQHKWITTFEKGDDAAEALRERVFR